MLTALFLSCALKAPTFGTDGPLCPTTKLLDPCECSETISWDPTQNAKWYETQRRTLPSGAFALAGTTYTRGDLRVAGLDANGDAIYVVDPIARWIPQWDNTTPRDGTKYEYRYRACNTYACGPWSTVVGYAAIPVACYKGGRRVDCATW